MKARKLLNLPLMVFATFFYMLGFISEKDLYNFIGSLDPEIRAKLEETRR